MGAAFVYILRCGDGTLYTGAAVDVERRLRTHRAGRASRYTRCRLPVELAWSKQVASWSAALREEHRIKSLPRRLKIKLIGPVEWMPATPSLRSHRSLTGSDRNTRRAG
jgi:putative endonuclease